MNNVLYLKVSLYAKELVKEYPDLFSDCVCDEAKGLITFLVKLDQMERKLKGTIRFKNNACYVVYELQGKISNELKQEMMLLVDQLNVRFPDVDAGTIEITGGFAFQDGVLTYVRKVDSGADIDFDEVWNAYFSPINVFDKCQKTIEAITDYNFPVDLAMLLLDRD